MHSLKNESIEIDLSKMPAKHVEGPNRSAGIRLIFFALLFGGLPLMALVNSISSGEFGPSMLPILLFPAISLVLILRGIKMFSNKKVINFDKDRVEYSEGSLLGQKAWSERLTSYIGIGYQARYYHGGKNRPSYTVYTIEMRHHDKRRNICLYKSRIGAGVRKILENYCRRLNMSAIEGDGDDMVLRDVEDLDKSVSELAAEGKIEIKFDPSARPPTGFKVQVEHEGLRIFPPKQPASIIGTLAGLLMASFLIFLGVAQGFVFPLFLFGFLFGAITIGMAYWSRVIQTVIIITDRGVRFYCDTPRGRLSDTSVLASKIEAIRIGKKADNRGSVGLLLVTDFETSMLCEGLPRPGLEWLKNCILAVITRNS